MTVYKFIFTAGLLAFLRTGLSAQTNTFPTSGNVGVGTTSPQEDLHLYSASAYRPQALLESVGNSGASYLVFEKARASSTAVQSGDLLGTLLFNGYSSGAYRQSTYISAIADSAPSGSNVYSALTFVSRHSSGSDAENMRITSAGNVGIGTSSPAATLDVAGGNIVAEQVFYARHIEGKNWNDASTVGDIYFQYFNTTGDIIFNNGKMVFRGSSGSLGIGTLSPTYPLTVNGTIRAKEVIVDAGWSDYVFDTGYRLAPLSEVEAHIKAEKHLPGVPTTREIAAGGVSLGEMQAKLLAKIEELTLHMIEQEKRIEKQQAQLRNQGSEIGILRTELTQFKKAD